MSERYRVVPTATFQLDIERLEEHVIQRELASHTPDDTGLSRFRDEVERAMGTLGLRHTPAVDLKSTGNFGS
ncbi:MAG: hypothetical protein KGO01_04395 [Burkholderiales bacterium]|nr:hypothetical protein [Burkholderiales bacterium]MDE1925988.1 hypothetical protein [Burkholderiales bacterium]